MKYLLPFVFILTSCSFSSSNSSDSSPSAPADVIVKPLNSISVSPSASDFAAMALNSTAGTQTQYGLDEMNSSLRGRFSFDASAKKMLFDRSIASAGTWADTTVYPSVADGSLT